MAQNVFAPLIRPAASVLDYMGQMEELDSRAVQRQAMQAQLAENQRKIADAQAERNALSGLLRQSGGDQNKFIGLLEQSGVPSFYQQAQGYRKAMLDARKTQADIDKDTATAGRTKQQTEVEGRTDALSQLQMLRTPDDARASLSAAVTAGKLPMQQAQTILQSIPNDPQGFEAWKQQMMEAAMGPEKAAELRLKREIERRDAANSTLVQDASGQWVPNQPLIDAKERIARAGASQTVTYGSPMAGVVDGQPVLIQPGNRGGPAQLVTTRDGRPVAPAPTRAETKPLSDKVVGVLKDARENAAAMDALAGSFKPEYGGKGVFGLGADMQVGASANIGVDRGTVDWWKNYRKQAELVERHAMFGASLTQGEQAAWRSADISPGMDPKVIQQNLATRRALSKKVLETTMADMVDAGHDPKKVTAIGGRQGAASALGGASSGGWKIERE